MSMGHSTKVFVSGGCKNGKSSFAEQWVSDQAVEGRPLYYLATMLPKDDEDHARVARHRASRAHIPFTTLELARDFDLLIRAIDTGAIDAGGVFLLDSTTALLENEMFTSDGTFNPVAASKVIQHLEQLLSRLDRIIIVSDYLFSDALFYTADLTEHYRKALAEVDRTLARLCDRVVEVSYGCVTIHKGD